MDEQERRRQDDRRHDQQQIDQRATTVRREGHGTAIRSANSLDSLVRTFESLGYLPDGTSDDLLGPTRRGERSLEPLDCSDDELRAAFDQPFRWAAACALPSAFGRANATGGLVVEAAPDVTADGVRVFIHGAIRFGFAIVNGLAFPLADLQRPIPRAPQRPMRLQVETWSDRAVGAELRHSGTWEWPPLPAGPVRIRIRLKGETDWDMSCREAKSTFRLKGGAGGKSTLVRAWWGNTVIGAWPMAQCDCDIPTVVPEGQAAFALELLEHRPDSPRLFEVTQRVEFPATVRGPARILAGHFGPAVGLGHVFVISAAGSFAHMHGSDA